MHCLLDHFGALKPSFRRHHCLIPEFCRSLLDAGIWSKLFNLFQGTLQAWTSLLWPVFATPATAPMTPNGSQMRRAALYTLLLPLLKCCPGSQTATHCPLPLLRPHVPYSRDELNSRWLSTSQTDGEAVADQGLSAFPRLPTPGRAGTRGPRLPHTTAGLGWACVACPVLGASCTALSSSGNGPSSSRHVPIPSTPVIVPTSVTAALTCYYIIFSSDTRGWPCRTALPHSLKTWSVWRVINAP